jgi:hypothetical protein
VLLKATKGAGWYTPTFNDNRDSKTPFRVWIDPISMEDQEAIEEEVLQGLAGTFAGARERAAALRKLTVGNHCTKISTNPGLQIETGDGTIVQMRNGQDLVEYLPKQKGMASRALDLFLELDRVVKDGSQLDEEDEKNSDSRSDSQPVPIATQKTGAVPNAGEPTEPGTETS